MGCTAPPNDGATTTPRGRPARTISPHRQSCPEKFFIRTIPTLHDKPPAFSPTIYPMNGRDLDGFPHGYMKSNTNTLPSRRVRPRPTLANASPRTRTSPYGRTGRHDVPTRRPLDYSDPIHIRSLLIPHSTPYRLPGGGVHYILCHRTSRGVGIACSRASRYRSSDLPTTARVLTWCIVLVIRHTASRRIF